MYEPKKINTLTGLWRHKSQDKPNEFKVPVCLFKLILLHKLLTPLSPPSWAVASSLISLLCSRAILCVRAACVLRSTRWRHWITVCRCLLSHALFIEKAVLLFALLMLPADFTWGHFNGLLCVLTRFCCIILFPLNALEVTCTIRLCWELLTKIVLHRLSVVFALSFLAFKNAGFFFHNQIKTYLTCFSFIILHDCNNTDVFLLYYQSQDLISTFVSPLFHSLRYTRYLCIYQTWLGLCFFFPVTSQEVSKKQFKCPHPVSTS